MFPELKVATLGAVVDEAHLFGLLARFRMLGQLVTEMRQARASMGVLRRALCDRR
ncbi:hypothetical protein GCM10010271_64690 [Streptomyces kurssanovii]|nr:hypothetical protein GCM10010271_64690 [Streptomyces kurssanovii]